MCGFGGIVNSSKLISRNRMFETACKVNFRGPDSTGIILLDEKMNAAQESIHGFFFNRLAIIDLDARSDQPFQNERYLLMFNGEIYNYQQLRADLLAEGAVFKTSSDTEVLFQGLIMKGKTFINHLNGMFAFFFLDKHTKRFLVSRDRIGIKPLYYRKEHNTFIFASELHTVVRLSEQSAAISQQAVRQYLTLQYVPTPNTILEGISKLPPGHFIEGSVDQLRANSGIQPIAYWDAYTFVTTNPHGSPKPTDLENVLVESVRGQLQADVPLGVFLSSGVDSSLITAIVNKHFRGRPFNFFTVAFSEDTISDESAQAKRYLEGFNNPDLHHHTLTLSENEIAQRLERAYDFFDEPFGDHAGLLNWAISEKARGVVTVALSGDGADEMFWGYQRYNEWRQHRNFFYKKIPALAWMQKAAMHLPMSRLNYTLRNRLETDPVKIHFDILRPRSFGFLPSLTNYKGLWCLDDVDGPRQRTDLPALLDVKAYLADAMLYKVDRASMASSLEVRVPYLDNAVIDFALRTPLHFKSTREFSTKAPLKTLLKSLAPHYNIDSPKRGFNFPLDRWMKNQWHDRIRESITPLKLTDLGLDPKPFIKIIDQYFKGKLPAKNEVWYLFNLILWFDHFNQSKNFNA